MGCVGSLRARLLRRRWRPEELVEEIEGDGTCASVEGRAQMNWCGIEGAYAVGGQRLEKSWVQRHIYKI
jgi:hypothetical protein